MILDTVAMIIGYFVMFIIAFTLFIIMPLAAIGRHHAKRNEKIYKDEMRKIIDHGRSLD